jgi:hypothetical protein
VTARSQTSVAVEFSSSSGLLCRLSWFKTDVSGLPIGPIFKDKAVQGGTKVFCFLDYYAAYVGSKSTFRDYLSVPFSMIKLYKEELKSSVLWIITRLMLV